MIIISTHDNNTVDHFALNKIMNKETWRRRILAYLIPISMVAERMLMRRYPMARMYDGMGMVVEVSKIIHNSRAEESKYRQVEMTPIMMDPVRREQQMQEVRNAIFVFFPSLSFS